ncbi:MAG: nickel-dependent lactate racemase [Deltaproteobacteria bacterium]|nr:nickel-dependent lactate racemase [Deltaproteobacteria bacterium]
MDQYFVWHKKAKEYFRLPQNWSVLSNAVLPSAQAGQPVYDLVSQALAQPIGSPPLAQLVKPGAKVVLIVDDLTRPTPHRDMVRCLIDHLNQIGVADDQIDLLFALGTHRPLTDDEVRDALGQDLVGRIRYSNHDAWAGDLVRVGVLPHGGELKVNPLVVAADLRIAIGSILPHPMNGFGGGAKTVMPGVSNFEAIRDHHLATLIAPGTALGNMIGNPFREEICQAARLAGLDFIVNAVYNSQEQVKGVVCGHFEKAHQRGVELSLKEYAVEINQDAEVSIVSAFPFEEGPQLMKPLLPGIMVTKKGGTVILYAGTITGGQLPDPFLSAFDYTFSQIEGRDPAQTAVEYLNQRKLMVPAAPMDFNCAIYLTLFYLSRVRIILTSPDATADQAARLKFDYAADIDQALKMAAADFPRAKVNILPSGGLIVPLVKEALTLA